jgi:beta-glucosidase
LNDFYWAAGIENTFIPQRRAGLRSLDEYELTQHYQLWREDLDRIASLGVSHLRWGIPWYRVNPAPGRYQWQWVDDVLDYMINVKGIQPILDLVHYGTPQWLDNAFLNHDYPQRVAEYTAAVVERYGRMIRFYTPLNEPTVNADLCGLIGRWPPYLEGGDGYVKVLLQLIRGMVRTAATIRELQPDAVLVQVEALGLLWSRDPELAGLVAKGQAHHYLAFDLFTGRVDERHLLWPFLRQHGVGEHDLAWLQEHAVKVDILGVNLYPWSGGEVVMYGRRQRPLRLANLLDLNFAPWMMTEKAVTVQGGPHVRRRLTGYHLADVLRDAWARYQIPMMITETSARRDVAGRRQWMEETITAVQNIRGEGIPVVGYTWFPALTMIDWSYRSGRRPLAHYLLHLGLWDSELDEQGVLQRRPTELVEQYCRYVNAGPPDKRPSTVDDRPLTIDN